MVVAAVSVASILLIAAIVTIIALSGGSSTATTFPIQSVTGLTLEDAVKTLEDAGLDVIPVAEETSNSRGEHRVEADSRARRTGEPGRHRAGDLQPVERAHSGAESWPVSPSNKLGWLCSTSV